MGSIFYWHTVVVLVSTKNKCQIWRQDTQCLALRRACECIELENLAARKLLMVIFLVRYYINRPLLMIKHIRRTQKWAWGHRCSLRHNVCRHATDALANEYNLMNLSVWEMFTYGAWPTNIRFTGVFYLLIKTELYLKIFILKFLQNFYNAFSKNLLVYLFNWGDFTFYHKEYRGKLTKRFIKLQKVKEKYDTNHTTLEKNRLFKYFLLKNPICI